MALFDVLPDELFKPLASPSRRFYADLLLLLHEKTFGLASEAPRRTDVIHEIGDFLSRWEPVNGMSEDSDPRTSREDRARTYYQRLVETGWLIEHKDRYIRLVDIDPDATGLLNVLAEIMRGETRTYGGAVIGVLSALESAASNPDERSENVRNAIRAARDFLSHMRMVSVSLRKVEDKILRQDSRTEIFRSFFEDFVQKHLVADYKTLHTKNNPFRFRARIIAQARAMSSSPLTVMRLGEAYYRENRAPDPAMGQVAVLDDLAVIVGIFESTEAHLSAIDATAGRIERRIMNTVRYMDRVGRSSEAGIIEAMKAVANAPEGEIDVKTGLIFRGLPIGPAHIATPRRDRAPVATSSVRANAMDRGFELYLADKADYLKRTKATPSGLFAFLERALGDRVSVTGSGIEIASLDDLIVFQRLRELDTIFDGAAARRFSIEMLPGRIDNGWLDCQDFVIKRRKSGGGNGRSQ